MAQTWMGGAQRRGAKAEGANMDCWGGSEGGARAAGKVLDNKKKSPSRNRLGGLQEAGNRLGGPGFTVRSPRQAGVGGFSYWMLEENHGGSCF